MEPRETSISLWSRRVMEACWLLALLLIPIYFSLLSDRHFEPDKAVALRALVLVLGAAWIINLLERGQVQRAWPRWRDWRNAPLVVPALVYAAVFLLTTLTSILAFTSFFGGYNRLQGTYTNLSYMLVFGAIVAHLRRREQLDRLITVIIATALPVLAYGFVQFRAIDPLPWAGDTAARVASTMGNSIFVAAYLIIVLPFVLYRLTMSIISARRAAPVSASNAGGMPALPIDLAWMLAMGLLVVGQLATLYGVLKLGALLQAPLIGFGHWWIFPGAVIVTGSTLTLFSYRTMSGSRTDWRVYLPGALVVLFMLSLTLGGYLTAPDCPDSTRTCYNVEMSTASRATNFRSWLLLGMGAYFLFYLAALLLPRRSSPVPSRLMNVLAALAYGLVTIAMVLIIFFTQSRGPQIGMFVSIFTFITLLLLQGFRTTSAKRVFGALLGVWIVVTLAGAGFLITLNTNPASFSGLRENRYIARLGNLLETEGGTGIVRVLIWRGDEKTRGAVGLITSNPLRTVVGWGPETMFVAYNQFYPPRLANYESRGASPDRSHQAMLDELVTKGALGLFSHLFLFGSFAILMLRLLRVPRVINLVITGIFMLSIAAFFTVFLESGELGLIALVAGLAAVLLAAWLGYARPLEQNIEFGWQVLIIACIAAVVANFVENIFGIPIVSSLLYTWTVMGIGVVAGMFAGAYALGRETQVADVAVVEEAAPIAGGTRRSRGAGGNRPTGGRAVRGRSNAGAAPARAIYAIIGLIALAGVWFFNLDNIYADMRFLQAKQWIEQGNSFDTHILGYAALREAIDSAPNEDLYYLMYGRALMSLATDVSQIQNEQLQKEPSQQLAQLTNRQPDPNASLDQLPPANYDPDSIREVAQKFASSYGPLQILDFARLALQEAQTLNPGNKDHPANLGRLHASWFRNIERVDAASAQSHLDDAIKSYEAAHKIAPQDVELAGQWVMLYLYKQDYDRAVTEMERIADLDPIYAPSFARLGEAKRRQGDLPGAAAAFSEAVALDPRVLTNSLLDVAELPSERSQRYQDTLAAMQSDPALLDTFLDGYARAIARRPQDVSYRQVYTQILSDTGRFQQGLAQATEALALVQQPEQSTLRETFERFVAYFESRLNS
ncbi:MAG: O-antigen ligase family protein [Herpetosiphonaceae bacterium]|nr:O-antigen ligase family protein [Herpetosiphonaceae bacterium]